MSIRPSRRRLGPALRKVDGPDTGASSPGGRRDTSIGRATRPAASLDSWLARDWSQSVSVTTLDEFQQIHVCTQNTLYELIIVNASGDIRVRGGRYFPDWSAARLAGCTGGGSFLKRLTIALGLQMEIESEGRRIVTSPVRTIALLEHRTQKS
jgi:hypothetical protein